MCRYDLEMQAVSLGGADRMQLALEFLRDPVFDALLTGNDRFSELPDVMSRIASGELSALCHTITYETQ